MSPLHVAIVAGVTAVLLLWHGLRGYRVGDHPFCRRCGFDLFGRPDGSAACPECGVTLLGQRSSVIGVHHRRPWAIFLGSSILLLLCAALGVFAWGTYRGVNWTAHKPVWYLAHEAAGSDVLTRDAALAELLARYSAKKLTKPQVSSLLDDALAAQARVDQPWAIGWGDFIESAFTTGDVREDQWRRYLEQSVGGMYALRYRRKVTSDLPFAYALDYAGARVATHTTLRHVTRIVGIVIDGKVRWKDEDPVSASASLSAKPQPGHPVRTLGVLPSPNYFNKPPRMPAAAQPAPITPFRGLDPGEHHGFLELNVFVADGLLLTRSGSGAPIPRTEQMTEVNVDLPIDFEVVPPGTPLLTPVEDPAFHDNVPTLLRIDHARVGGDAVQIILSSTRLPPVNLSFGVYVRQGSQECQVGYVVVSQQQPANQQVLATWLRNADKMFADPSIDVVFRADPRAALMLSPDISSYLNGEVVLKDVPFR